MQLYPFERIYSQMEKDFRKIKKETRINIQSFCFPWKAMY